MVFDMKDYVEVADRIAAWYHGDPQGRIVTEVIEHSDTRFIVKASVYRTGEDVPAGTGHSFLAIPGSTPYTKGSELENAETSAVGRALVMAGIPSKNIASAGEIQSKKSVANAGGSLPGASPSSAAAANTGGVHGEASGTTEREQAGPTTARVEPTPLLSSGVEEAGADSHGPCPSCSQSGSSPLKPDGKSLPAHYVRCLNCGMVRKEG